MDSLIDALEARIQSESLDTPEAREAFRVRYLGRKSGEITDLMKGLKDVPAAERPAVGQRLNTLRSLAETRIEEADARLQTARAEVPRIDVTLPGRRLPQGSLHPITETLYEIERVFARLGFSIAEGPEIEDDFYNFTALGFPPDHPARDMQDTFFLKHGQGQDVVLRTHTSPVQIRVMERQKPPLRLIVPGRVYRNESISYKSFCLFHQVEGLVVDKGVTFADLKAVLHLFAQALFGEGVKMRFRPSFFPFTEPSAEVDIYQPDPQAPDDLSRGRWLEILGCGMVDPVVFGHVGIDAEAYTGYAFGMGVERIAMLRYGIDDIRLLYENDVRLLAQF